MGRALGFVGLLISLAIGAYLYTRQAQSVSPTGASPTATINLTGVRNDLIAVAQAERRYFALNGKYASIDELRSNGDISPTNSRGPFAYTAEYSDSGFRITATYSGNEASVPKSMSVDENMEIKTE